MNISLQPLARFPWEDVGTWEAAPGASSAAYATLRPAQGAWDR
ncbi:hypothetical protein [Intrasporangium sp.]